MCSDEKKRFFDHVKINQQKNKNSNYLISFNRYGIPFTVIYGPRARTGIVLPELLSVDAIKDAIEAASFGK